MPVASPKSNVGCPGCGLTGSWSDSRSEQFRIVSDRPQKPRDKVSHENYFSWQAQNLESPVVPHVANDVSYATRINHAGHDSCDTLLVCHFLPKITSNSPMSRDLHRPVPPKLTFGTIF